MNELKRISQEEARKNVQEGIDYLELNADLWTMALIALEKRNGKQIDHHLTADFKTLFPGSYAVLEKRYGMIHLIVSKQAGLGPQAQRRIHLGYVSDRKPIDLEYIKDLNVGLASSRAQAKKRRDALPKLEEWVMRYNRAVCDLEMLKNEMTGPEFHYSIPLGSVYF